MRSVGPGGIWRLPVAAGLAAAGLAAAGSLAVAFAAEPATPMRLTGIVVGPQDRVAIFAGGEAISTTVREGETVGDLLIQKIGPDTVLAIGPEGEQSLAPQGDGQPGERRIATPAVATPALEAAREEGTSAGRLATQHDSCVRRGLSPASRRTAEDQLRAMLDSMSNLPLRSGEAAASDAPARELATAMRAGWEATRQQDAGIIPDQAACSRIDGLWKQAAIRYGFD